MSFNFQAIVDLLKKLRANKTSTPKYKILVTILKVFLSQEIPDLHTVASAFEESNNISSDSQVAARSTPNAIYLEYQLSEARFEVHILPSSHRSADSIGALED
jgi:hypothetical protein